MEQKIIEFLQSRKTEGFIKLGDFLKSLYPIAKNNEPVEWQKQPVMKSLRAVLAKMQSDREIVFSSNSYKRLGRPYWPDSGNGHGTSTNYYHIGNVIIEAKLP